MKRVLRAVAVALILAFSTVGVGCLGKYALFNKVLDWNATLGDKFVNSLVHFAFWVVPIYPITLVGDVFIFNTIDFWTGNNPVDSGRLSQNSISLSQDGQEVALHLHTEEGDYLIHSRRGEPAYVYRNGILVGMGEPDADDGWVFHDLEGGETRVALADELAAAWPGAR